MLQPIKKSSSLKNKNDERSGGNRCQAQFVCLNLDQKINKYELKKLIYSCFSPYGLINNIYATKRPGLKGQAL